MRKQSEFLFVKIFAEYETCILAFFAKQIENSEKIRIFRERTKCEKMRNFRETIFLFRWKSFHRNVPLIIKSF